jgi:hypothetical protein
LTPRGTVCEKSGLLTKTRPEDMVVRNGDRINTVTGAVVEQGLGTAETDAGCLGREGLKAHDFEHFKSGISGPSATGSRGPYRSKKPVRRRGYRSKLPVLGRQDEQASEDSAPWLTLTPRNLAKGLVKMLKTAQRDADAGQAWSDLTAQQETQLAAHLSKSIESAPLELRGSPESLCVLAHSTAHALQNPVRLGYRHDINSAHSLKGSAFVSDYLMQQGFGRSLTKLAQDHINLHAETIFGVRAAP